MVILITRACQRCGRARLCPDEISPKGIPTCIACSKAHRRRSNREWFRNHPEFDRERNARPERRAMMRAAGERWLRNNREWVNETGRINYRLRAERKGRSVRPLTPEQYETRYGTASGDGRRRSNIDAGPLVRAIREWLDDERDEGVSNNGLLGIHTIKGLERRSGVTLRTITRWLAAENPRCSLVAADRVALAIGTHLDLLYDDAPGVTRGH